MASSSKSSKYVINLPPDWVQSVEKMAASRGQSVPDFLKKIISYTGASKTIKCNKCDKEQTIDGEFPELVLLPVDMPFGTRLSFRFLTCRWLELHKADQAGSKPAYFCSVCSTLMLKPLAFMLEKFMGFGGDADMDAALAFGKADRGSIKDFFSGILGTVKQLPPPKK